jgi:hypothetical protein
MLQHRTDISSYFIKDTTYHIQFPQQVNTNCIMKASLMTGIDRDTFGGALLYHLQRKEDTLISTQLLMLWECKYGLIYLDTLLIEHESTFTWNEDKLKRLWHVHHSRYDTYSIIGRWLLNDNTMLRTVCEALHKGFEMMVIISEEQYRYMLEKSLWFDSNR